MLRPYSAQFLQLVTPSEARNLSFFLFLFTKSRRDRLGPVRKMIEGFGVRGVEVQRRDGNGAGENRRVIGVRLNVLVNFLLEQPKITAAPRILAFRKLVARDFL